MHKKESSNKRDRSPRRYDDSRRADYSARDSRYRDREREPRRRSRSRSPRRVHQSFSDPRRGSDEFSRSRSDRRDHREDIPSAPPLRTIVQGGQTFLAVPIPGLRLRMCF